MIKNFPNLIWLRSFEAVARGGSFTAASDELGLTQAAVSSQIRALESQLGCALFARTTRRLALTEMGRAYLPSVRKALNDLTLSTQGLFGGRAADVVTLRAPISTASLVLAPDLPALLAAHPGLKLRMISAIWAGTVPEADIDVDLRLGDGRWQGCRSEQLGEDRVVAIRAPGTGPALRQPDDLLNVTLVHILGFEDHWSRYFAALGWDDLPPQSRVSVDTTLAAAEFVAAGGGIALVLERAARRLVAAGRAALVRSEAIPLGQAHYLVVPEDGRPARMEVETVKTWLRGIFTAPSAT